MTYFVVGKLTKGIPKISQDVVTAFKSFVGTEAYKKTISDPIAKEQFTKMLEIKKQQALAKGDSALFELCGRLTFETKQYTPCNQNSIYYMG